jgi:hypothetical protein
MPTEAEQTSVTPIPTHTRGTPTHLDSDSGFEVTNLKVSEALEEVKGPIYHPRGCQNHQCEIQRNTQTFLATPLHRS